MFGFGLTLCWSICWLSRRGYCTSPIPPYVTDINKILDDDKLPASGDTLLLNYFIGYICSYYYTKIKNSRFQHSCINIKQVTEWANKADLFIPQHVYKNLILIQGTMELCSTNSVLLSRDDAWSSIPIVDHQYNAHAPFPLLVRYNNENNLCLVTHGRYLCVCFEVSISISLFTPCKRNTSRDDSWSLIPVVEHQNWPSHASAFYPSHCMVRYNNENN